MATKFDVNENLRTTSPNLVNVNDCSPGQYSVFMCRRKRIHSLCPFHVALRQSGVENNFIQLPILYRLIGHVFFFCSTVRPTTTRVYNSLYAFLKWSTQFLCLYTMPLFSSFLSLSLFHFGYVIFRARLRFNFHKQKELERQRERVRRWDVGWERGKYSHVCIYIRITYPPVCVCVEMVTREEVCLIFQTCHPVYAHKKCTRIDKSDGFNLARYN